MKRIRIVASIVVITLCVSMTSIGAVNAKTYNLKRAYTFKGKIIRVTYNHPEEYESWVILKLKKAIKVKYHGKKIRVKYLDIYSSNTNLLDKIDKKVKKKVKIKGKLFRVKKPDWDDCEFAISATKLK